MSVQGQRLNDADRRHLEAAEGWLGLGNWREARQELDLLAPPMQVHPQVLKVRWEVLAAAKNWPAALEIAATLIQSAPQEPLGWVHRSFCLHELKRTEEARDNLLRVVDQFTNSPTIRYNLACYECQLGRLDQARAWLRKALQVGGTQQIKQMALQDPDLKPLWPEIAHFFTPEDAGLNEGFPSD